MLHLIAALHTWSHQVTGYVQILRQSPLCTRHSLINSHSLPFSPPARSCPYSPQNRKQKKARQKEKKKNSFRKQEVSRFPERPESNLKRQLQHSPDWVYPIGFDGSLNERVSRAAYAAGSLRAHNIVVHLHHAIVNIAELCIVHFLWRTPEHTVKVPQTLLI